MTQKEIIVLMSYIYNNRVRMEEVRHLQNNIRFRNIDVADCIELICAIQQLDTFNETTKHIRLLLGLNK